MEELLQESIRCDSNFDSVDSIPRSRLNGTVLMAVEHVGFKCVPPLPPRTTG